MSSAQQHLRFNIEMIDFGISAIDEHLKTIDAFINERIVHEGTGEDLDLQHRKIQLLEQRCMLHYVKGGVELAARLETRSIIQEVTNMMTEIQDDIMDREEEEGVEEEEEDEEVSTDNSSDVETLDDDWMGDAPEYRF